MDEIGAFLRREQPNRDGDELDDLIEAARARGAQEGFQLRKREFDRIEVGTVRREKPKVGPDAFDGRLHRGLFVHDEVVEHHHIARPQRRDKHLLDVGEKGRIVDRAIEDRGRVQAVQPQGGDNRVRLPVPTRRVIAESQTARASPVAPQEMGRDTRFIEKDVAARIAERQPVLPAAARGGDIRAPLFVGVNRFFSRSTPVDRWRARACSTPPRSGARLVTPRGSHRAVR